MATESVDPVVVTVSSDRLRLRDFSVADAPFIVELLNEPGFIRNIRDSGVRTLEDAARYIADGPTTSYARCGYGLWRVSVCDTDEPVGMCGLLKRDTLPAPDIGFAFLERFWRRGYATEAAQAVVDYARGPLGLERILAVTAPHNAASGAVLEKVGLRFTEMIDLTGRESRLYTWP